MIGIVLGKEIKTYTSKNDQQKTARTLYVLWDQKRKPDGLDGNKCEAVFVPFEIPEGVNVGTKCEFEYDIQPTKNGSMARLVDIMPIQKLRIDIAPDVKH